jgi:hypothetical protein
VVKAVSLVMHRHAARARVLCVLLPVAGVACDAPSAAKPTAKSGGYTAASATAAKACDVSEEVLPCASSSSSR